MSTMIRDLLLGEWVPPKPHELTTLVSLAEDCAELRGLGAIHERDWQQVVAYVRFRLGFTSERGDD
jgi:hypothetical protein